jgi:hypothetical protein
VDRATCSFTHIPKNRIRDSPDDSRTGVNSSDFLASPEARRELPAATRTTGGPNGDRSGDFPWHWGRTPSVGCS